MLSVKNRRIIIVVCTTLLILLLVGGFILVVTHPSDREERVNQPSVTLTPGLVVYGEVRMSTGEGVEGVQIFRGYAGYPGELIATTDANGAYESDFEYIPGDEMVTVRATGLGMTYTPEYYFWRHYHGYERERCDFIARIPMVNYLPIIHKQP